MNFFSELNSVLIALFSVIFFIYVNYRFLDKIINTDIKKFKPSIIISISWFLLMAETGFSGILSFSLPIPPLIIFYALIFVLFFYTIKEQFHTIKNFQLKFLSNLLRNKLNFLILYFAVAIVTLIMGTRNTQRPQGFYTLIGSLHTGKYAFIADYIRNCNTIPIIQASWGQSVFVGLIGSNINISSVLLLYLFLCTSIFFLTLFVHGFFSDILVSTSKNDKKKAYLPTILVITGNFTLSLAYVLVNDSGNPIIFNGYSDVIFGIFTTFLLYMLFSNYKEIPKIPLIFIITVLFSHLFLAAPQVMLLSIPSLTVLIVLKYKRNLQPLIVFVISLAISFSFWRGKTGMLTHDTSSVSENWPGVGKLANKNFLNLFQYDNISPGIPYVIGKNLDNFGEIYPQVIVSAKLAIQERLNPERFIWHIEQMGFTTIRVLFWPLLGFIIFGYFLFANRSINRFMNEKLSSEIEKFKLLWIYGFTNFLCGFTMAFFFAPAGSKWEMARFSFPGLILGLVCLVLFLEISNFRSKFRKLDVALTVLLIFPTVFHLIIVVTDIPSRSRIIPIERTEYGNLGFFEEPLKMSCQKFIKS